MIDISVQNVKKSFGGATILDGITFEVNAGERVALLGPNGAGKTTLLKLLTGELTPDEGTIVLPAQKRLGLISQIPVYPAGTVTEDVLRAAHRRVYEIAEKMAALAARMETRADAAALAEYDRLSADFERLGGYDADFERDRVANGLQIGEAMRARPFDCLSGGEKTRVNLARLILEDTDILLLDEPTNHLDLRATQWLEDYIAKFKGTVLAVSHDRWFLDAVAKRTIELVDGRCSFYSGNYSFFVEERRRRNEELQKQYDKNQKEIAHLSEAADKLHLWAFLGADKLHKRAFSMERRIEKLQTAQRPQSETRLKARFSESEFSGDEVLTAEGLSKAFGEKTLFSDLELLIEPGERVALMGDNGSGKSTLVKILLGEELPDAGRASLGPSVRRAYLPQIVRFEHPERTLLDTMLYEGKCLPQQARDRLAAFQFTQDDVFKPVSALSGGELSRLRLCLLMKSDVNFLILDEPTNHLDIASREWIESALEDFEGTLLFVSHDRWFVDRFATRVWELDAGRFSDFRGGYQAYLDYQQRQTSLTRAVKETVRRQKSRPPRAADPARELAKVERQIGTLEEKLAAVRADQSRYASDYQKLLELDAAESELNALLAPLYERWEALSE